MTQIQSSRYVASLSLSLLASLLPLFSSIFWELKNWHCVCFIVRIYSIHHYSLNVIVCQSHIYTNVKFKLYISSSLFTLIFTLRVERWLWLLKCRKIFNYFNLFFSLRNFITAVIPTVVLTKNTVHYCQIVLKNKHRYFTLSYTGNCADF